MYCKGAFAKQRQADNSGPSSTEGSAIDTSFDSYKRPLQKCRVAATTLFSSFRP